MAACLHTCYYFPEAVDDEGNKLQTATTGDSLQCRTNAALEAETGSAAKACPEAGENGGIFSQEVCGSACDNYCDMVKANCGWSPAAAAHNYLYKSRDECMKVCMVLPISDGVIVDMTTFLPTFEDITSGNSVGCRRYHASVIRSGEVLNAESAAVHCPHTGKRGGDGVCGGDCDYYCSLMNYHCIGPNAQFADQAECLAACNFYPADGSYADPVSTSGNNRQCRIYHAEVAGGIVGTGGASAQAVHCPHAGQFGGDGVCGTSCQHFCDQAMSICADDNAIFASQAQCEEKCGALSSQDTAVTTGDTLGCRMYHLGVASKAEANKKIHCPHADEDGSGVCVSTDDDDDYSSSDTELSTDGKSSSSSCSTKRQGVTITQNVNLDDESILMTVSVDQQAWLAFGVSPTGKMTGATVVIGKPDEGTVKQ
jgi:hypothetical protein